MRKVIGELKWVLVKGYPQISGQEGIEQLTVKYTARSDGIDDLLPEYGSYYINHADPFFERYSNMRLNSRTITPLDSGNVLEITLVYAIPEGELPDFASAVSEEWEYDTQDYDVPIAQHEKYRYCWNHKLIGKIDKTGSLPARPEWFNTAVSAEIGGDSAANYKWIKPGDKPPDGWNVVADETKPGVESFRSGITTVQLIKRSGSKANLERDARSDYTIQAPKETFGRTGIWLRGGSKIRKCGKKWELTVSFLNSKNYDEDLYS